MHASHPQKQVKTGAKINTVDAWIETSMTSDNINTTKQQFEYTLHKWSKVVSDWLSMVIKDNCLTLTALDILCRGVSTTITITVNCFIGCCYCYHSIASQLAQLKPCHIFCLLFIGQNLDDDWEFLLCGVLFDFNVINKAPLITVILGEFGMKYSALSFLTNYSRNYKRVISPVQKLLLYALITFLLLLNRQVRVIDV